MSNETPKPTTPHTRELKRTAVSASLAEKIRAVDAALEAEFGSDFAFVILARGAVCAASNERDGVIPPLTAPPATTEGVS